MECRECLVVCRVKSEDHALATMRRVGTCALSTIEPFRLILYGRQC